MTISFSPSPSSAAPAPAPAPARFLLDLARPWGPSFTFTPDELYALTGDATASTVNLFGADWHRVFPVTHPNTY